MDEDEAARRLHRFLRLLEKLWAEFLDGLLDRPESQSIGGAIGTPQDNKD